MTQARIFGVIFKQKSCSRLVGVQKTASLFNHLQVRIVFDWPVLRMVFYWYALCQARTDRRMWEYHTPSQNSWRQLNEIFDFCRKIWVVSSTQSITIKSPIPRLFPCTTVEPKKWLIAFIATAEDLVLKNFLSTLSPNLPLFFLCNYAPSLQLHVVSSLPCSEPVDTETVRHCSRIIDWGCI